MDNIASFLEMGGYARFIWPAYGLVTFVMVALLVSTLRGLKAKERQLAALQEQIPGRRGRSRDRG